MKTTDTDSGTPGSVSIPVVCGPTACGKTSLAVDLFGDREFEAVSADSVQIYKRMDIGSAKISSAERQHLPHHLIDIRNPDEIYSAGAFFKDCEAVIPGLLASGKKPLILGGTGLYIKTLLSGFFDAPPADNALRNGLQEKEEKTPGFLYSQLQKRDPETAERLFPKDHQRIIRALEVLELTGTPITTLQRENTRHLPYRFRIAAVIHDRDVLEFRIKKRMQQMFTEGLVEEVRGLLATGYSPELPSMQSLGYKQVYEYLSGILSLDDCRDSIASETRAFARRQIMLFKRIPGLTWINGDDRVGFQEYFSDFLNR